MPLGANFVIGPFEIELIRQTHSIPEPSAVVLRCGAGTVVHTGDWKFDPTPFVGEATDFDALRAHMAESGIVLSGQRPRIRVVTHLDVTAEDVDRIVEAVAAFYKAR